MPTDRELDLVLAELGLLRKDMSEIKDTLAEQRGWIGAAKWMGAGSLAGAVSLAAQILGVFKNGGTH